MDANNAPLRPATRRDPWLQSPFAWSLAILSGMLILIILWPMVRRATDPVFREEEKIECFVLRPYGEGLVELATERVHPLTLQSWGYAFEHVPLAAEGFLSAYRLKSRDLLYTDEAARRLERFCQRTEEGQRACTDFERYYLGFRKPTAFLTFAPHRETLVMRALTRDGALTEDARVFDTYDPDDVRALLQTVLDSMRALTGEELEYFRDHREEMGRVRIAQTRPLQLVYRDAGRIVNRDLDLVQGVSLLAFRHRVRGSKTPLLLDPEASFSLEPYVRRKRGVRAVS